MNITSMQNIIAPSAAQFVTANVCRVVQKQTQSVPHCQDWNVDTLRANCSCKAIAHIHTDGQTGGWVE